MNFLFKKKDKASMLSTNEYFKPDAMIWVSKAYLLAATILHLVVLCLYIYSGVTILAINSIIDMVLFFTFFCIFDEKRIRFIYTTVIIIIQTYVLIHVFTFGWNYNFFIYSFMMIPLSILSSISVSEKRYNVKLPIMYFLVTQGSLLIVRIYNIYNPIKPIYHFEGLIHNLYTIEGIIVYVTTTIASFVPLYAFILDLNKAYARMDKMNEDLIYTATHDHLTGLINRRSMSDYFDKALINYNLNKKTFSVIIADIDNFKKINDTYGHNNGDVILKSISNIMMSTVGEKDHVCRWGGEEILVLVDGDLNHTISLAENIRKCIEATTFIGDGVQMRATITSGVAEYNLNPSIEDLINIADDHLYKGKQSTKNCVIA